MKLRPLTYEITRTIFASNGGVESRQPTVERFDDDSL